MMVALESRDLGLARHLREEIRLHTSQIHEYRLAPGGFPVLADMFRGMAADLAGDPSTALAVLRRCGRRVEHVDGPVAGLQVAWRPWAARQYVRLHDTAAAMELVDEDLRIAEAWGAPKFIGRALRMRATLVGGREALALAESSVETLEHSHNQLELARSLVSLGQLLREAGDLAQAETRLRRGHDLAVQCGAHWAATRAESEMEFFPQRGARQPLTGTQRTVASWAAQGLTNRDIAKALGITSRAVEKHLTAVYRKLLVTTRSDLRSVLSPDEMVDPPADPAQPPEPRGHVT
jgi:DNA-binding CsgD family transcriptional regulator